MVAKNIDEGSDGARFPLTAARASREALDGVLEPRLGCL